MKKGHIFFIMGVSGAGKGTLIENLKKQKEIDLSFARSYVTRPMRKGEIDGNIYNFITKNEFELAIKNNEFLEYFKVYGLSNYYGTKYRDVIDNGINAGKIIIKEIDMNGLLILKSNTPELKQHYSSIFLNLPLNEQLKRIKARGVYMGDNELKERKKTALEEHKKSKNNCDFILDVTNYSKKDTLNKTLKIISSIINK